MARSKSSGRWLREHHNDPYVKRARQEGYRSRAVYKLSEINQRDKILHPGQTVVDLGAAPGGWAQYAAKQVSPCGMVIATDILPMDPIEGVVFIEGDFREQAILDKMTEILDQRVVDLVISDMAPNKTGVRVVDQPRGMHLAELAVDFCDQVLRPGGDLLIKVFQGEGFESLLKQLRERFNPVASRKPLASRARSNEQYLLARNYRVL